MDWLSVVEVEYVEARGQLRSAHRSLRDLALTISERMATFAERLEREGVERGVNELGELQGLGPDLDRLCAIFAERQRRVAALARIVAAKEGS
jgi:hypothetical protein